LGDHFYKPRTIPEVRVLVNDRETCVQVMLKLLKLVNLDHLGCTIGMLHIYMGNVHWFVHVVSNNTNIFPFQIMLTYLGVQ
jgi:hypothetical protein